MALRYLDKVDMALPMANETLDQILRNEVLRAMPVTLQLKFSDLIGMRTDDFLRKLDAALATYRRLNPRSKAYVSRPDAARRDESSDSDDDAMSSVRNRLLALELRNQTARNSSSAKASRADDRKPAGDNDAQVWCTYHQTASHTTSDCRERGSEQKPLLAVATEVAVNRTVAAGTLFAFRAEIRVTRPKTATHRSRTAFGITD